MKSSENPPLLAATHVGLATTRSLGGFFRIHVNTRELIALSSQLYTEVISAVVREKQSTANAGLGSEVKTDHQPKNLVLHLFVTL